MATEPNQDDKSLSVAEKLSLLGATMSITPPQSEFGSYDEWTRAASENAKAIWLMAADKRNPIIEGVEQLARCNVYTAVILDAPDKVEAKSSRLAVKLRVPANKYHRDGTEIVRTERCLASSGANPDEIARGRAMATAMRGLVGHKILLYKEVERDKDGAARGSVIRHYVDLGEATEEEINPPAE